MARLAARRAAVKSEVNQLSTGVATAKSTMEARYVPDTCVIRATYDTNNATQAAELRELRQFFGSRFGAPNPAPAPQNLINTGLPNWGTITNSQCLVFFLGGYVGGNLTQGFSDNPVAPFTATGRKKGPFFDFKASQLNTGVTPWTYHDTFTVPGTTLGRPYQYVTTKIGNGDYPNGDARVQRDGLNKPFNYTTYQIWSFGPQPPQPQIILTNW